jgi:hypothetical protein
LQKTKNKVKKYSEEKRQEESRGGWSDQNEGLHETPYAEKHERERERETQRERDRERERERERTQKDPLHFFLKIWKLQFEEEKKEGKLS